MNSILLIVGILFSTLATAAPVPLKSGTYEYKDFLVRAKKRHETVYAASSSGKDRLIFLRSEKYICALKIEQIYLCSAFLPVTDAKAEIKRHVENKLQALKLVVTEPFGSVSLTDESDNVKTYDVPQKIEFRGTMYLNYRYLVSPGIERMLLGNPAAETFIFGGQGETLLSLPFSVTESKTVYYHYLALAEFEKISAQ